LQNARDPFASIRQRPDHVDGRGRLRFRVDARVSPVIDYAAAQQPKGPSGRG
jgi:hypothetical protein